MPVEGNHHRRAGVRNTIRRFYAATVTPMTSDDSLFGRPTQRYLDLMDQFKKISTQQISERHEKMRHNMETALGLGTNGGAADCEGNPSAKLNGITGKLSELPAGATTEFTIFDGEDIYKNGQIQTLNIEDGTSSSSSSSRASSPVSIATLEGPPETDVPRVTGGFDLDHEERTLSNAWQMKRELAAVLAQPTSETSRNVPNSSQPNFNKKSKAEVTILELNNLGASGNGEQQLSVPAGVAEIHNLNEPTESISTPRVQSYTKDNITESQRKNIYISQKEGETAVGMATNEHIPNNHLNGHTLSHMNLANSDILESTEETERIQNNDRSIDADNGHIGNKSNGTVARITNGRLNPGFESDDEVIEVLERISLSDADLENDFRRKMQERLRKPCKFGSEMRATHFGGLEGTIFNTASYGCTPEVVTQRKLELRRRMEGDPLRWHCVDAPRLVEEARANLAEELHADPACLCFVPNANTGTNTVLKSLPWAPGDSLLAFSIDYDASLLAYEWLRYTYKIRIIIAHLKIPATPAKILSRMRAILRYLYHNSKRPSSNHQMGSQTAANGSAQNGTPNNNTERKLPLLASFCHVTSKTAFIFPVKEMVEELHRYGISALVDGAQAAGHIPLNLQETGAEYYIGTVHKWMYACPGVAFLYAARPKQPLIEPLITCSETDANYLDTFNNPEQCFDLTGYIATTTSLDFVNNVCGGFGRVRKYLGFLAEEATTLLTKKWGTMCIQGDQYAYGNMPLIQVPMPNGSTPTAHHSALLMMALWENHKIMTFIFVDEYFGRKMCLIRLSVQIFHTIEDFERLGDLLMKESYDGLADNALDFFKSIAAH